MLNLDTNLCYWHVVYVRPKSERLANDKLQKKGLETYLPLITTIKKYKSQKKKVIRPLFPGYLFVHMMPGKRHHVTSVSEVYNFIKFDDDFAKVRDEEIKNIQIALDQSPPEAIEVCNGKFSRKGRLVEVIGGPFAGVKGKTLGLKSRKVLIQVGAIQSAISIVVSPNHLRLI